MKSRALCVFFVTILFFIADFSFAATSNISGLVFSTNPQTVKPNEVSKEITAQTQNSSGTVEKVDETNDTTFTSSSPSGQFLNSSGNPVSTTMSKNTSSRTFYYKDSAEGVYTLTVSIKGRETGKIFLATQQIIISLNASSDGMASGTSTNATSTSTTTATSTDSTQVTSGTDTNLSGSSVYSYLSGTPLSKFSENDFDLKAYAGRDRVAFVNSPVKFNAQIKTTNLQGNLIYTWSFGDGSASTNKSTEHYYAYPGTYNVVLNVSNGFADAVSSSKIEVLEPKVSLSFSQGQGGNFAQISNNSDKEMNLAGYRISYGARSLIIPQDTIVSANSNIKIPLQISETDKVSLAYPNGLDIAVIISGSKKNAEIANIQSQVTVIENKIAEINKTESAMQVVKNQDRTETEQIKNEEDTRIADAVRDESIRVEDGLFASTTEITAGENTKDMERNKNFIDTLLSTPKKIFDFIKW
ncbi:MAG: PKD domain-containing protein [Candidatus Paceibacterota bacterium]